jgi:hypothetical protein
LKKRCFISVLLCFCLFFSSFAQDEQLVHKTHVQRAKPLSSFYESLWTGDSARHFRRINNIKKLAIDNKDDDLLMEAELLRVYYFFYRKEFPPALVLSMMDSLMNEGIKRNKIWLVVRTEYLMAYYDMFIISQYELGFEHFHKMYNILEKFTADEFPYKELFLYSMAHAYYNFSNSERQLCISMKCHCKLLLLTRRIILR